MPDALHPTLVLMILGLALALLVAARWHWRVASRGYPWREHFSIGGWYEIAGCAVLAGAIYYLAWWMNGLTELPPIFHLGPKGLDRLAIIEMVLWGLQYGSVLGIVSDNEQVVGQHHRDTLARAAFENRCVRNFRALPATHRAWK